MKIRISRLVLGAVILLPLAAPAQTRHAKVKITAPANGATVSGPVKVILVATGVEIVPATVERPGTGHHHLFVFDSLTPGPHRVIAVVADWKHVPLKPLVVDTVRFTVK